MSRWSLIPPLPGESSTDVLTRLITDLNLILAEQEQDAQEVRGQSGYTARLHGTLNAQGNRIIGLAPHPQSDDEATSLAFLKKSGRLLYSEDAAFRTTSRIEHHAAMHGNESTTLDQVYALLADTSLKAVPFITIANTSLLDAERVLTGSSTIALTDAGANATLTLSIPSTALSVGTYTPTLFNTTNIAASTAYLAHYVRILTTVLVYGKVDVDPTAAGSVVLGLSLPIASNFAATENCTGTAFSPTIAGQGASILADTANDRATMQWIAVDVTNQSMYFSFVYRLL